MNLVSLDFVFMFTCMFCFAGEDAPKKREKGAPTTWSDLHLTFAHGARKVHQVSQLANEILLHFSPFDVHWVHSCSTVHQLQFITTAFTTFESVTIYRRSLRRFVMGVIKNRQTSDPIVVHSGVCTFCVNSNIALNPFLQTVFSFLSASLDRTFFLYWFFSISQSMFILFN